MERLFKTTFTSRLYIGMVILIVVPMIIVSFFRGEMVYKILTKQKEKELIAIAKYLSLEMPGSFEDILNKEGKINATKAEKINILNRRLQTKVNKFSKSHPDIGMGYFDLSIKNVVAIGPHYSQEYLISFPETHAYLKYVKTRKIEVIKYSTSLGWEGKPILAVTFPLFKDGKLIGHTWANVKIDDILAEVTKGRNQLLFVTFVVFCFGVLAIHYFTSKTRKALELFAELVVRDSLDNKKIPNEEFPELKLLVQQVTDTREEISRYDRLNLVGQMAAGIGHEIRNPLTTVRGFLQMLGEQENNKSKIEYYNLMIEELDRANLIITEFLTLARDKTHQSELISLTKIIDIISPLIAADCFAAGMDIEIDNSDLPELQLNVNEIRQVVLNLVRNGIEAMAPGGKITVKTYIDKEEIILAVRDTGTGISPEILKKVGTPFFTTKENGTGLGLAACYSIAKRNNGKVEIETNENGTTFYVKFTS